MSRIIQRVAQKRAGVADTEVYDALITTSMTLSEIMALRQNLVWLLHEVYDEKLPNVSMNRRLATAQPTLHTEQTGDGAEISL